jgi:hypothetical protein
MRMLDSFSETHEPKLNTCHLRTASSWREKVGVVAGVNYGARTDHIIVRSPPAWLICLWLMSTSEILISLDLPLVDL